MSRVTKDVVVVGGSLAGLMNAIVLRDLGCKVHVLERSSSEALRSEAAGIRAGPAVHAFIERYVKNHSDYAITAEKVEIVNDKGEVLKEFPPTAPLRLTTWKVLYDMLRSFFLEDKSSKIPATYETRQTVEDVTYEDGKLLVTYRDLESGTTRQLEPDLVIAADGSNSTVRSKISDERSPKYAGYVTWRGIVREDVVATNTRETLRNRCVILRVEGGYLISYYVPADDCKPDTCQCEFVWIWYDMQPEDSREFQEIMTDANGKRHFTTIPRGKVDPKVWRRLLDRKNEVANPHFIELMNKTEEPFVSAIRDLPGSQAVYCDGKIILAGDALALCRPHGGGSTSEAALQAIQFAKVWEGNLTLNQWERESLESARKAQATSLGMAEFFFTGKASSAIKKTVEPEIQ